MKTIRVGSRASKLAVIQAEMVMDAIRASHPEVRTELVTMTTTGDQILDRTLDKIGGKGLFVKELDRALLAGEVDITVHSMKDLPTELNSELPIVAVSERAQPYDALVLPQGVSERDPKQPIGCASARRRIQLQKLFPDAEIRPIRGNLQTRLAKLDAGEYGALVLAQAGLARLGLEHRIHRLFSPEEILPSACQGILAVQARAGEDVSYLSGFHNEDAMLCAKAERAFIRTLDGGCSAPVAAFAEKLEHNIRLTGLYVSEDETVRLRETITVPAEDAPRAAAELAHKLKQEANR